MVQLARNFLRSAWECACRVMKLSGDAGQRPPAELRGLFSQLTDEQKQMALNYKGPTNHGDPAFLIKNTRAGSR